MYPFFFSFISLLNNYFQNTPRVDLSWNHYAERDFEFYDSKLVDQVRDNDEQSSLFFSLLALCHTVMAEFKDDGESFHLKLNFCNRFKLIKQ